MKTVKRAIALVMIMFLADLAFDVLERETGLSRDEVRTSQIFYEDGIWSFSVVMKNHPEDEDGLLVFETDDNWNLRKVAGETGRRQPGTKRQDLAEIPGSY